MADPTNLDSVRGVLDRHRDELRRRFRAVGVGIGKEAPSSPRHAIVIYLASQGDAPSEPVEVESVPVRFEVTGEFKPLTPGG